MKLSDLLERLIELRLTLRAAKTYPSWVVKREELEELHKEVQSVKDQIDQMLSR